ncbi:hypothetical protein KY289_020872 [Solanum tuberosum]|nr:hypothetical protein KY289_020872 [Solanum tuberosum]
MANTKKFPPSLFSSVTASSPHQVQILYQIKVQQDKNEPYVGVDIGSGGGGGGGGGGQGRGRNTNDENGGGSGYGEGEGSTGYGGNYSNKMVALECDFVWVWDLVLA